MAQNETCIERIQGEDYCTVYTSEIKFYNKLKKLKEENPNLIDIIEENNNEDKYILAHVPSEWMKFVGPPRTVTLTAQQREERKNRLAKAREMKNMV